MKPGALGLPAAAGPAAKHPIGQAGTFFPSVRLTLASGDEIEAPTGAQVESALRSLPGGEDSFAILSQGEQVYIQTSGGPDEGYALEYRDGSQERHFRCADPDLSIDPVVRAFLSYLEGGADYESDLPWTIDEPSGGRKLRVGWVLLGVVGVGVMVFYRCLA